MKKGDIIVLDCGRNGCPDDQVCRILEEPSTSQPLFAGDMPTYSALVEILATGEQFTAVLPPP